MAALLWSYGGALIRVLLQLVFQLLLARLLGPEAFGQASIALIVLGFGWILSEAGFGSALIQKQDIADADIRYALGWVALTSVLAGAVIAVSAPWLAGWLGDPQAWPFIAAAAALIPIQAVSNIPASLMRRRLDAKRAQTIFLSGYALAYGCVGLPAAWMGAGAWALVASFGLHSLYNLVCGCIVTRCPLRPSLRGEPTLRTFGLKVTLANMGNWATENVDRMLVARFWGSASLGAYGAAANLSRAPVGFMLGSLQSVAFASAAKLQGAPERLAQVYLGMLAGVSLLTWPIFVAMAVHADALIALLYGHRWSEAGPLFGVFSLALLPLTLLGVTGPLLWALNVVSADIQAQVLTGALLVAGLCLCAALPLQQAVWVVLPAYWARSLWMLGRLSRALSVSAAQLLLAFRGGLLLLLLAATVALSSRMVLSPNLALLGTIVLGLPLFVGLLLWQPAFLLGPLGGLMREMAADFPALKRLCRLLRLEVS
ncbi:oligosaccharide flippase family protein [Roseateles paludis]|uniref:Oligosaccharide flippase family protein n=1 Tax=Roseateles paludis TaxID=3145238 RepID=A0ABV0G6N5_9BURK